MTDPKLLEPRLPDIARVYELEDGRYRVFLMKGSKVEVAPSTAEDAAFESPRVALEFVRSQGITDAVIRFHPQDETLPLYARLGETDWYVYQASGER